jgi:RNA polymerase sigma-70 factor (ECF subfamily)
MIAQNSCDSAAMHTLVEHWPAGSAALAVHGGNTRRANTPAKRTTALRCPCAAASGEDGELVRRAKAGDLGAFEALVSRHERRLYTLARRITGNEHDAEDVTQQTFLSALENLAGFREEARFSTWLLRIGTNAALKILRKRDGLPTVSLEATTDPSADDGHIPHPEYIADWRESPEELVHQNETRRLIDEALARIDDRHRLVFVLREVEGLSVRETAHVLGLSEVNVKVRLLRARLQLRERLTRAFGDPARRVQDVFRTVGTCANHSATTSSDARGRCPR